MTFVYDDGGRKAAGFNGVEPDCCIRSIAIAAKLSYTDVSKTVKHLGTWDAVWKWVESLGFERHDLQNKAKMTPSSFPEGRCLVFDSRCHLTAVIDRVVHDVYDPCVDGRLEVRKFFVL